MDRRLHLKIKIKTLAEEARIIRREESKQIESMDTLRLAAKSVAYHGSNEVTKEASEQIAAYLSAHESTRRGLREHRIGMVRRESRLSQIAYAVIRGKSLAATMPKMRPLTPIQVGTVIGMIERFGDGTKNAAQIATELHEWIAASGVHTPV